ncbi:MAG: hypothetical protein J5U17_02885 [Candidatus Methanoperedens sp.]|nr:hypothetical protein [Candidatus Methanoperedens sp.]MCE8424706.1 hypothetical protein [Candidatus Methanoperedens sp.]MCE8427144.1 hypothetical protein [Candidatus Methanoperedens sp.]
MTTERDIIIERLEQKLAARDKEIERIQESMRESIIADMEKKFMDKMKLRESTIDDIKMKFTEKVNEIIEMNKSLRDSLEQRKTETDSVHEAEGRMERVERRLMELNSAYDGVMKELLDQKSILQELRPKKNVPIREQPVQKIPEAKPREETKQPEKSKTKGEYIIAENYVPRERKKQQVVIEADEVVPKKESNPGKNMEKTIRKSDSKRSENVKEGVEIIETQKRR